MSHIAEYQCELDGINIALFKECLKLVAFQLAGGVVSDTVDSVDEGDKLKVWGGRFNRNAADGKKIFASIRSKNLPQGVGIHLDKNNKINFLLDPLYVAEKTTGFASGTPEFKRLEKQAKDEFGKIQSLITINYQVLALTQVLAEIGYEIEESTAAPDNSAYYIRAVQEVNQ